MINKYHSTQYSLTGSNQDDVLRKSKFIYSLIASATRRKPYIRSVFFKKEKVFLDYFWQHLYQKNRSDRHRRLELYACALDLIENSHVPPEIVHDSTRQSEVMYRFYGVSADNKPFIVQIKEIGKRKNKHFISVFPHK